MPRTALMPTVLLAVFAHGASAADLAVRIEGIRSAEGHLLLAIAGSSEAWNGAAPPAAIRKLEAQAGSAQIVVGDLAPGRYAIQVMHDANGNGELDTNVVGMPIEAYGFSNNPQVMRKATFEEAAIELPVDGASVVVQLN